MATNYLGIAQQVLNAALRSGNQNGMVNAPWRDAAIQAIQNGDAKTGQELANNIVQSYGFSSPQEAAQSWFQNRFQRRN